MESRQEYEQEQPVVPSSTRRLRACMRCHLLKTESQVFFNFFSLEEKRQKYMAMGHGILQSCYIRAQIDQ